MNTDLTEISASNKHSDMQKSEKGTFLPSFAGADETGSNQEYFKITNPSVKVVN